MDGNTVVKQVTAKFSQSKSHFEGEASKLRTGRAHPSMLDGIVVEAYGTPMPLLQVGSISVPEPTLLQISPFDPNNIAAISDAIRADQQLGFNPSDDGRVVRVPVPALTTERREQIVKTLKEKMEETLIAMRNHRHEAMKSIKNIKDLGQDEVKALENQVDEAMQSAKSEVEEFAKTKEEEIMTV